MTTMAPSHHAARPTPSPIGDTGAIRVVVADDNLVVRQGLIHLLEMADGFDVVAVADDGERAVELCRDLEPDVAVFDVEMPFLTGLEATAEVAGTTRVLIASFHDEPGVVNGALDAGAHGFLVHGSFDAESLAHAVRTVATGGSYLSPRAAAHVIGRRRAPAEADGGPTPHQLTRREASVMQLMSRGLTNRAIADELSLSEKTIKNNVNRIYAKLGARDRGEAIATWLGTNRSHPG